MDNIGQQRTLTRGRPLRQQCNKNNDLVSSQEPTPGFTPVSVSGGPQADPHGLKSPPVKGKQPSAPVSRQDGIALYPCRWRHKRNKRHDREPSSPRGIRFGYTLSHDWKGCSQDQGQARANPSRVRGAVGRAAFDPDEVGAGRTGAAQIGGVAFETSGERTTEETVGPARKGKSGGTGCYQQPEPPGQSTPAYTGAKMVRSDFRRKASAVAARVYRFVGWLFLSLFLGCSSSARAGDWSTGDTYRQAVVTGLLLADWGQTRDIAQHPNRFQEFESRPVLGDTPSVGKVNNYFAVAIIGHAAVSYLLPTDWRAGWQYVVIGVELNTVAHNRSIGLRVSF